MRLKPTLKIPPAARAEVRDRERKLSASVGLEPVKLLVSQGQVELQTTSVDSVEPDRAKAVLVDLVAQGSAKASEKVRAEQAGPMSKCHLVIPS